MTTLFKSTKTLTTTIEVDEVTLKQLIEVIASSPEATAAGAKLGIDLAKHAAQSDPQSDRDQ